MAEVDAIGNRTRAAHDRKSGGYRTTVNGAIVFDEARLRQASQEWFDQGHWGRRAQPVQTGGRGSAWFIDAPFGPAVLRHYRRGGLAARVSSDRYLWQGERRTRSFAEYCLTEDLHAAGLPVPQPLAASYERDGAFYRAAILLERLSDVQTFAERVANEGSDAPWESTGRLIARFHHAGLDHADLNANNILYRASARIGTGSEQGWLIDFDHSRLRASGKTWRENNLARLLRSLQKLRGSRRRSAVDADFTRLYDAYEQAMAAGP